MCIRDRRYSEQVIVQTDANIFKIHSLIDEPPYSWLENNVSKGAKIGYDPRLFTPDAISSFENVAKTNGFELIALDKNPIDLIWSDRPAFPSALMKPHSTQFAGENSASKIARIAEDLSNGENDCAVLTAPMALAWVFNIRGGDVSRTPLTPVSYTHLDVYKRQAQCKSGTSSDAPNAQPSAYRLS